MGYYGDPAMVAQYSASQLAAMRHDQAGFTATLDRDDDGAVKTYRTGFWQRSDDSGDFLVVFERGHQRDFIEADDASTFLSWHGGGLRVSSCDCPVSGDVRYAGKRLDIDWAPAEY